MGRIFDFEMILTLAISLAVFGFVGTIIIALVLGTVALYYHRAS